MGAVVWLSTPYRGTHQRSAPGCGIQDHLMWPTYNAPTPTLDPYKHRLASSRGCGISARVVTRPQVHATYDTACLLIALALPHTLDLSYRHCVQRANLGHTQHATPPAKSYHAPTSAATRRPLCAGPLQPPHRTFIEPCRHLNHQAIGTSILLPPPLSCTILALTATMLCSLTYHPVCPPDVHRTQFNRHRLL